jgi:hypothetical protein
MRFITLGDRNNGRYAVAIKGVLAVGNTIVFFSYLRQTVSSEGRRTDIKKRP